MNNDLVKVHKDFTKLNIGTLSEKELELFYYICLFFYAEKLFK